MGKVSISFKILILLILSIKNSKPNTFACIKWFIAELATSKTPVRMDTSEEGHSELFKSAVFQGEPGDRDGGDMLGTHIRLLEAPQIQ